VVSFDSYFLLSLGVRDVTFCYFLLLAVILGKLFFTVETGKGAPGERVHLDFILFLFTVEGEGGGGVCFFFDLHLTCGRRKGKGYIYIYIYFLILFFDCGVGRNKTGGQILEFGVPK
jgi:hypothetical protein